MMKCPVCGSKRTIDDEYGSVIDDVADRRLTCEDCESQIWQRGTLDDWGDVYDWKIVHIEPSERGEEILAAKRESAVMKLAQELTIPMFDEDNK